MQPGLTYGWMNALTAVYGLPAGPLPATNSKQKHPNHSFAAGFMIIDVIGVKWSLVLSNVLLMSARLLLAFTTKTSVAVFVLYFLMPFGQALNIPVRAKMSHFSIVFVTFSLSSTTRRLFRLLPLQQVLTIAVRRYTNDDNRSIAYAPPPPPLACTACFSHRRHRYSWFYVVRALPLPP